MTGVLLCSAGSALSAAGAEYRLEPSLYLRSFYDDNLILRAANEIKTFALAASPGIKASIRSDTWQYELDTTYRFIRMEDDQYNSDDPEVSFSAIRVTPTTLWQFFGQMQRATTRTTDLESAGLVDPQAQRRELQSFRPVMQWSLSSKDQLTFGASMQNVHYDALTFEDYDNYGGDIKWSRQISEKTALELTGFGSLYKTETFKTTCADVLFGTDSGDFESETYGLQFGFTHQASAQLNFGASAGHREVSSSANIRTCFLGSQFGELDMATSKNSGLVLDASVEYVGENYRIDATLSRSVSPAGLGFLIESNDLAVEVAYHFSEQLSGRVSLTMYDNEAVDSDIDFARDGVAIQPWLSWRLSEQWDLEGGLRYRTLDSINANERKGLQVFVGAQYEFKPWSVSR